MTKTKILSVLLASLACVALLGSCDYWKEDYYKSGGDTASVASGGSGSGSTASVPTYSGSMTVNSVAYTTLTMDGTASSGTATLSGSAGSLSGTYARAVAAAAAASEFTGSYTITFSSGTITVTFNGNSITLTNGSITASGTATLVVQTSGGSTAGSSGSGGASSYTMNAEEQSVYNSLVGTWKSDNFNKLYTIRNDGTVDLHDPSSANWEGCYVKKATDQEKGELSEFLSFDLYGYLWVGYYYYGEWYSSGQIMIEIKSDGTYTLPGYTRM